eukprot:10963829-Alexandrium_andersonii.AAC.1
MSALEHMCRGALMHGCMDARTHGRADAHFLRATAMRRAPKCGRAHARRSSTTDAARMRCATACADAHTHTP